MAYDEDLADRIREQLGRERVTEKKMFGGLAFLIGGNMSVAASGNGGILVRVDPAEGAELLARPGVEPMAMGGRAPMKGWLRVAPESLVDDAALADWVRRGVSYARSLPPK
jgi:TfoX/Sxy family transcriptional regulator of competence genes